MVLEIIALVAVVVLLIDRSRTRSRMRQQQKKLVLIGRELDAARRLADQLEARLSPRPVANTRRFIQDYTFPPGMVERALAHRELTEEQRADVEVGLRQFLYAAAVTPGRKAGMPSQLVDDCWHAFITYTRDYAKFCEKAYGSLLHHVPEATMSPTDVSENRTRSMLAAWNGARAFLGVQAGEDRVPDLFAVDATAGVPHADRYVPDCGSDVTCAVSGAHQVCVVHGLGARRPDPAAPPRSLPSRGPARSSRSSRSSGSSGSTGPGPDPALGLLAALTVASSADCGSTSASSSVSSDSSAASCGSSSASCASAACGSAGCGSC